VPRLSLPLVLLVLALGALAASAREFEDDRGTGGREPRAELAPGNSATDGEGPAATAPGHPGTGPRVRYRDSVAIGSPSAGRLIRGVRLPAQGAHFFTWDPIRKTFPNRHWRRFGTDDLVRTTLRVVRAFGRAHPNAPRVAVGDLSRTHGGDFGPQFGSIGHASHQNGLDVDIYYPRLDRAERAPASVPQVDRRLAQDLVDRFVEAGAVKVFVGPSLGLRGPRDIVVPLVNHDNHLHARFAF